VQRLWRKPHAWAGNLVKRDIEAILRVSRLLGHVQEVQENSLRWLVVATLPHGQIVKVCTRSGIRGERPRVSAATQINREVSG
jgi:hypothetical protein